MPGQLSPRIPSSGAHESYQSASTSGTGAALNFAHGLDRVPSKVSWSVVDDGGGAGVSITEGVHTSTNVILTYAATTDLKVHAE